MNNGIVLKKGDTLPILVAYLVDSNGNAIDLTGCAVAFTMSKAGVAKIDGGACTIVTAASGKVSYTWGAADTNTVGVYNGEFTVTSGSNTFSVPTNGYITVEIKDTL